MVKGGCGAGLGVAGWVWTRIVMSFSQALGIEKRVGIRKGKHTYVKTRL
jgi:hypothetical protein